ncbi:MAG: YqgE/AlgH family protein [bacterium]|nr:YqgE/AlgH family protein [bacterium]
MIRVTQIEHPENGCVLIAHPIIEDPHFYRTVVLLCEFNDEGAYGLILNRPLDHTLSEVLEGTPIEGILYEGGPVRRDSLHILHRIGPKISGSKLVKEKLYWGGELEEFAEYLQTQQATLNDIRFCAGYAGWSKKQLLKEIEVGGWILIRCNLSQLFDLPAEDLWRILLKTLGGEYFALAFYPPTPILN